ncbi:glycosyltransferase, partial [Patescibacteria group bacterium]|nr:glycosyltransferase [Patescibacteria group bacterium]
FGANIIYFLEHITKPVSITLHTVLSEPDQRMKEITVEIINKVARVVVMTEFSKKTLMEVYGAEEDKIKVIPHGIHPQIYSNSEKAKTKLNLSGKKVLTTYGFLSSGKGIEYAIRALPKIVEKYPEVMYMIVGETHPVVRKNEGEVYRERLEAQVHELGLEKHVIFKNEYVSLAELLLILEATDIYLSMSQDPNQTVSGTLSYALGAGRAVISTPFKQAQEVLNPHMGVLIPFKDHENLSREVIHLFNNPLHLESLGKTAYFNTRKMTWQNTALSYMSMFATLLPTISEKNKYMLPIKVDYLEKLTDDFSILQIADLNNPDQKWGYTLDDAARALVVMSWCSKHAPFSGMEKLAKTYLSFIQKASKESGGFINYFDVAKKPHDELNKNENLEDADARALWALSTLSQSKLSKMLRTTAKDLFEKQFLLHQNVHSPRAAAFYIKAFVEEGDGDWNEREVKKIETYADFLVSIHKDVSDEKWKWFEDKLTYSNAVLPEALLLAYTVTKNEKYLEVGKSTLDFLIEHSFEGDICVPVGQAGWYKKGSNKERYDQQPEEVSALVLALKQIYLITEDEEYLRKMQLAFDWFLGNNLSHLIVYTHFTGGCYDGIIKEGANLNQGAESTLSYLLARLAMEPEKKNMI